MDKIMNGTDQLTTDALSEKAKDHWQRGEWEAGAEALFSVALVAVHEKAFDEAAELYMQVGQALKRVPNRAQHSCNAFYQAGLCYKEVENSHGVAQSLQMLAAHEFAAGNLGNGATILKEAATLVVDDVNKVVDLKAMQANCEELDGDVDAAEKTLSEAITLTQDDNLKTQLQQLQTWYRTADEQQLLGIQLTQIAEQAQQNGAITQLYDEQLVHGYELLAMGDTAQAIDSLQSVCADAVNAEDNMRGVRHFQATTLLAQAHEQRDDRRAVLDALETCRDFLVTVYGEEHAKSVDALQSAFAQRWSEDETALEKSA